MFDPISNIEVDKLELTDIKFIKYYWPVIEKFILSIKVRNLLFIMLQKQKT